MRRGHIGDRDGSRPPVCGLPPTLLCSKVHTVFLQLVAQPVGRLEVPSAARLLTLAHKFLNVRIGEARPARRARRLLRVHLRHVHGQDRSRSAIGGAPRAALIINRDAKLGQLLAQPISRIEIPGEARLLALHHERSHLLVYRTSTSGALLDERHRHGLGRCGRHGQLDRSLTNHRGPSGRLGGLLNLLRLQLLLCRGRLVRRRRLLELPVIFHRQPGLLGLLPLLLRNAACPQMKLPLLNLLQRAACDKPGKLLRAATPHKLVLMLRPEGPLRLEQLAQYVEEGQRPLPHRILLRRCKPICDQDGLALLRALIEHVLDLLTIAEVLEHFLAQVHVDGVLLLRQ
mmetsp:Transcript_2766/g.9318  ORF Transcript_2766/g.9318 Transcript_2766/m.9318 type:complete len:344 (+) Transcript_2766:3999-5030(+)